MKTVTFRIHGPFLLLVLLVFKGPAWAFALVKCPGSTAPGRATHATIQAAVDDPLETLILVTGNCIENVVVNGKDNLTIKKPGPALMIPTLTGDSATQSVLTVSNSRNFSLESFTVAGISDADAGTNSNAIDFMRSEGMLAGCTVQSAEGNGIAVQDNSSLTVGSSTVQNNGRSGISVSNLASVAVNSSTVQNNGGMGINLSNGSSAAINSSTVQNNGGPGINSNNGSSLSLGDTRVLANIGNGLNISNSSLATLGGDFPGTTGVVEKIEIANNGGTGINVTGLSNLSGSGAHLIHDNGGGGITVADGSNARLSGQSATQKLEISMNRRQGVLFSGSTGGLGNFVKVYQNNQNPPVTLPAIVPLCGVCAFNTSSVSLSETEVSTDPGHGFLVSDNSMGNARSVTITGNTGEGVRIERASGVRFQSPLASPPGMPTNISGNAGGSVICPDSLSWVSGDLTGIGKPIKCTELK